VRSEYCGRHCVTHSSSSNPVSQDDNWFENERLHRASAEGDLVEMRRLLACGYKLDVFDDLGHTPLHCAVAGEHYKAAEWLLQEGANVDAHDEAKIGETPLGLAVRGEYPQIVELLLKSGANPDITGWMAHTARSRAARRKDADGKEIAALIQRYRPR
jgi:ankyrin repeat protein